MDERRLAVYRAAIHPTLAVAIPFLFLVLLDRLLRLLVLDLVLVPNPPGTVFVLLLTGGAQAAVANALTKEKVGSALPRMRELLVILIVATVVFMATRGYLFAGDFVPAKAEVIYALVLVLIMWFSSFGLHRAFREREVFLSLLVGKEGQQLRTAVRSYSAEATESVARMRQVKRVAIWFQTLILLALFAALLGGREIGAGVLLLVLLHLALGLTYTAVLNGYLEEQGYFGGGFVLAPGLRRRRVGAALLFVALAALVTWPLVGAEPPLPASYLGAFFAWLNDLMTPDKPLEVRQGELRTSDSEPLTERERDMSQLIGDAREQSDLAARLFQAFLITVLAALGLGLIVFLVRPLFSRDLGEMLRGFSLAGLWRSFARGLSQALDTALAGLRRMLSAPRDVAGRLAATVTRAARERRRQARARRAVRSRLRQGAHGAAVRGFVRLIRWGERSGVPFRRSVAPLDYVRALGARVPERRAELEAVGVLFEELVYSAHGDSGERATRFQGQVRDLLRRRTGTA